MTTSPSPSASLLAAVPALTLEERLSLVRESKSRLEAAEHDRDSGRRWASKLRTMPPFDRLPHLWERFLAAQELTEEELELVLGAPAGLLATRAEEACRWSEDLEEALSGFPDQEQAPIAEPAAMGPQARLLTFSRPIITWALRRIRRGLRTLEEGSGETLVRQEKVEEMFLPPLNGLAYAVTHRVLVLELNVSRLEAKLTGETPAERFESFVARLEDPAYVRALHEEYAVLSRQLVEGLRAIADFCLLFLGHWAQDRAALRETFFGGEDPGPLAGVTMSGDGHRGGRRVLVLEHETGQKLLYKPHSLRVDEHFQDLLSWLDERGHQPPFRTLRCLDRGDHGWTEFVEAADAAADGEIRRFYLRQGGLLAVLYAMLATDIHHENLIASGEHPMLVDLESLFHPMLRPVEESQLDEAVRDAMSYSVLRTALLPTLQLVGEESVPLEIGGLSDVEGQQSPHAAPYVNMSVADEARIDRMRVAMAGSRNLPTLGGVKPDPSAYTEEIVEGFTATFRLLLSHREALLAPDGPLRRFAGDTVRFIFRNTRTYAVLLHETLHPDLQRCALDRDGHFLRLWALLEERRDVSGLIHSELEALWMGDIPFFSTRTDSLDLYDHDDRRHPDLLARSCLDEVTEHIRRLEEGDLARQVWFIRGAMACQKIQPGHPSSGATGRSFEPVGETFEPPSRSRVLDEARRIGDRLAALALRGRNEETEGATWLGMVLLEENIWQFLPLGIDLYNGLAGITFFLAYLAEASGEGRYLDLARSALAVLRSQQQRTEETIRINGAFTGWGGLVYLYAHLYHLWGEPRLLEEALLCARQAGDRGGEDENYEILYGNAGGILSLDALYAVHPDPDVLAAMEHCGQRVLSGARPMGQGVGWACKALDCIPLAGYSHGASGIAAALEALYRRTGREDYRREAAAALAYERTLFSEEHGNWKDVRLHRLDLTEGEEPPPPSYPVAWCNGAPGIGLARLRMPTFDDAAARAEVDASLAVTRRQGFGYTHSLCHGDLGNLELLLEAREAGWPGLEDGEVERTAAGILEGIRQRGWVCGTPQGIETPGLMLGLAGIGYGLLRLFDPRGVPSILQLDPPRTESSPPGRLRAGSGPS